LKTKSTHWRRDVEPASMSTPKKPSKKELAALEALAAEKEREKAAKRAAAEQRVAEAAAALAAAIAAEPLALTEPRRRGVAAAREVLEGARAREGMRVAALRMFGSAGVAVPPMAQDVSIEQAEEVP
jgi:hypothetical protein